MKDDCNEIFKKWFWCPKIRWFTKKECPYSDRQECDEYEEDAKELEYLFRR